MIGLSDVSSAAAGATSSGASPAPKPKPGDPVYVRGQHIDQEDPEVGGATCPNLVNDRDTHPQIEFIHFGNVHTSYGNRFPHDSYKDNEIVRPAPGKEKSKPPTPLARPRAIQFRSALEREAILLTVFIESAQTVFADGEGLLGSLIAAVGSLLGKSGGVGSVKSSEMNASLQKTIAAAGTINVASIQYHDTHKAGRDFHDARNDYRKLLYKVTGHVKAPPHPAAADSAADSSEGPTDPAHMTALDHVKAAKNAVQNAAASAASSATSGAKAMMDIISFSQSALMKKTDIKTMCFALLAAQQERQIESVCHDLSLAAITGSTAAPKPPPETDDTDTPDDNDDDAPPASAGRNPGNPFLPIWHPIKDPQAAKPAAATPQDRFQKAVTTYNSASVESVRGKLENKALDAVFGTSFLEYKKEGLAPGADAVPASLGVPEKSPNPADSEPMEIGELFCLGFSKVTGKTTLPDFARALILAISQDAASFLSAIYHALVERPSDQSITKASLVMASKSSSYVSDVQSLTSQKITDLIMAKANANSAVTVGGVQVAHVDAPGQAAGAMNTKIQTEFTEHVVPGLTSALHGAMGELSRQLELARRDAVSTKANTMEWYLGRLPYVQVTLFHNLFFPFWSALLRCLLGAVDGPAANALKSVLEGSDKMNSASESASPAADTMSEGASDLKTANADLTEASAAQQEFKRNTGISTPVGVPGGSGGMSADRLTAGSTDMVKSRAAQASLVPALPVVRGKFKLPFTTRVADGQGMEIEDYDDVKPHHQWDNAIDPNPPPENDSDPASPSLPGSK